jgi:hypothetical protein
MQARTAPVDPRRVPWPRGALEDNDDPSPIEEWTLEEVDSAFEFAPSQGTRSIDAAFD